MAKRINLFENIDKITFANLKDEYSAAEVIPDRIFL